MLMLMLMLVQCKAGVVGWWGRIGCGVEGGGGECGGEGQTGR